MQQQYQQPNNKLTKSNLKIKIFIYKKNICVKFFYKLRLVIFEFPLTLPVYS